MIAELGQIALAFALGATLVQAAAGLLGAHRGDAGLVRVAERAAFVQGGLFVWAFVALTIAHVTSDFSVANVVENSHTAKPLLYKFSGVWGNHEGSMLMWSTILAGYTAAVAGLARGPSPEFRARALGVLGLIAAAFAAFIIFTSNPFERVDPAPANGFDLNPLLQDPGLAIHPPMLYLGYVGMAVPFAFAVAALIERREDEAWARWARPWTLTAWSLLTLGIGFGAWWAYYELGWGGFWGWDPVENASLLPWIAGAALVHTLKAVAARGAFKSWAFLLAITAFAMSLVGAFLVRSGVLTSVHAFAVDPARGVFLLMILAATVGGSLTLYAFRSTSGPPTGFDLASRETAILVNNLVLMTILGTVFIGTFYPVFVDILSGERVSVGAPYFNFVVTPFALFLVFAIAVGQRLPWRRGDLLTALRPLAAAAAVAAVIGVTLIAFVAPRGLLAAFAIALGVWLVGAVATGLIERIEPWRRDWPAMRRRAASITAGVWGMNVAHLGVAVIALGAAGAGGLRTETVAFMEPGDVVTVAGGREITLVDVTEAYGPNYAAERGVFDVRGGLFGVERVTAEQRYYPIRDSETAEAGVGTSAAGDVYVTIGARLDGRGWPVSARFFPLAAWIWIGAVLVGLGGVLAILDHVRAAAPARRTAPAAATGAPAPAE